MKKIIIIVVLTLVYGFFKHAIPALEAIKNSQIDKLAGL